LASRGTCAEGKCEIAKNVKVGANTIKKTKFGTKNVPKTVCEPFFRPNLEFIAGQSNQLRGLNNSRLYYFVVSASQ